MAEYIDEIFGCVSANHVIAIRIIAESTGYVVQALTTEWAIDMHRCIDFDHATDVKTELAKKLRHQ